MQPKSSVGDRTSRSKEPERDRLETTMLANSVAVDGLDRETMLDRVGGDEDLLREITAIFLEEYPILLSSIREAVAGGDARKLEMAAHTLKGAVANFGAPAATQAAFDLEIIGKRGPMTAAPSALENLEQQFQALRPALESFL